MKMSVADFITSKMYEAGCGRVFLITGGMIMHLTDALLRNKKMEYVCCHHEQAAAMAAEAYGRFTGKLGVAYVTAGPGALNTITGVVGAYVDSSPCIIVAGQSKSALAKVKGVRQLPLQGFDNLPIFKHFTKYAVMLDEISRVRYEVEKCIYAAKSGRVGPVYLECPIDVQDMRFDPSKYKGFTPPPAVKHPADLSSAKLKAVSEALLKSRRPCILAGAGVRLSGAIGLLHKFAEKTGIPVITSRLGMDLMGFDHPLFVGHPGTYGDRPANFAVQNCDLLLTIGCRLGVGLVSYDYKGFAPGAVKIMVDVDETELFKPSVVPDIPVRADAAQFLRRLLDLLPAKSERRTSWLRTVREWKEKYPVDLPEYAGEKNGINSYHFTRVFSEAMSEKDIFVVDTGSCFHVHAQAFKVKFGQRHVITGGLSTMGYTPASMGVAAAAGRDVYCITGDGSLQMNLQEFQTVAHNKLPVKFVISNNSGYLLIRHTQKNFCGGRLMGESAATGVSFPDLKKIAGAYGISYLRIARNSELRSKLKKLKAMRGPVICEVLNPPEQLLIPRVASKKLADGRMASMPYDDMFPFLPREEYAANRAAGAGERL
jgi:acetolactate synthase-1/2/3 large subunit